MKPLKYIAISSGGVKGSCFAGALQYLYENKKLEHVEHYIGCSSGALLILLMLCGISPKEIVSEFIDFKINNWNDMFSESCNGFFLGDSDLRNRFEKLVGSTKLGDLKTKVTIVTVSLSTLDVLYIDNENMPDMKVLEACMMTSRVPFIFGPYYFKGSPKHLQTGPYLDGAICDPFPIHLLPKTDETLGICSNTDDDNTEMYENEYSIGKMFHILVKIVRKKLQKTYDRLSYNVINLKIEGGSNLFTNSPDIRIQLYLEGYNQAKKYFESKEK